MKSERHGLPCPQCGGSDSLSEYTDELGRVSTYCWSAKHPGRRDTQPDHEEDRMDMQDIAQLPVTGLTTRGLSRDTLKFFGCRVEMHPETGEPAVFYAPLYRGPEIAGYQGKLIRKPGQRQKGDTFRVYADPKKKTKGCQPFGAHAGGRGGRMVIVTEGVEDALAAYQMLKQQGKNYRVVATLGTDGWQRTLDYFSQFEKVAIAYDQDDAGRKAAAEFAAALGGGKAVVMRWQGADDPNALLLRKGGDAVFLDALNTAKPMELAGFVTGEEVWHRMENYVEPAFVPYPEEWELLNDKMKGIREAEITMFTGGSSVGKTAYTRRIKHHLLTNTDWVIGEVELEERGEKTWRGLMECQLRKPWAEATKDERHAAWLATYGTKRLVTLDHRSQYGRGQSLVSKFKHLHYGMGAKAIMLDHVTLAVHEFGDGQGNTAQDQMMNEFLEFVETTGCHLFLISHLRKSGQGGKSYEEGAVPTMDDLKGSGSLKQISFNIIGVSRNLMHENEYQRNVSTLHVMKCRETGRTGRADRLYWDDETRGLVPAIEEEETSDAATEF